jgi:hypothetical protein
MKMIDDEDAVRACRADAARAMGAGPLDRACMRVDRRTRGAGMRRGGRLGGTDYADPGLVGITNFSGNNRFDTAAGGGEAGVASGFGIVALVRVDSLTGVSQCFASRSGGASEGYFFNVDSSNAVNFQAKSTAGFPGTTRYQLTANDVGKVLCFIGLYTGAGALLRLFANRVERGTGTAMVGYVAPTSVKYQLSGLAGGTSQPATGLTVLADAAFQGVPTDAQLQDFFDRARARGDLPDTIDGATVTHRWSAKEELLRLPHVIGRKAYGARLFSDTVYLATAGSSLPGVNTGFWCAHYCSQSMLSGGGTNGILIGRRTESPSAGWEIYSATAGAQVVFYISQASGSAVQVIYNVTAADIGRPLLLLVMFDAAQQKARFIVNRTEVTAVTCTGYTPASAIPLRLGRHAVDAVTGNGADKTNWFGTSGGHASLTAAEISQLFDDVERTGRIASVAGKTDHLWDPTLDIAANALAMPTTIADRIGSDTLTRTGTLEVAAYTDTAPGSPAQLTDRVTNAAADALIKVGQPAVRIIDPSIDGRRTLGAQGFTADCHFSATAGIRGAATGLTLLVALRIDQLPSGTAAGRPVVNTYAPASSPTTGYSLYGYNGALNLYIVSTATNRIVYTPVAGDVGRLMVVAFTWDGTTFRGYVDAAQTMADAAGAFAPNITTGMLVGKAANSTTEKNDFCSVFAVAGCDQALTVAELQEVQRTLQATGRIVLPAGKINPHNYDLTADVLASGVDAVPSTVLDRAGSDNLTRVGPDVALGGKQGLRLSASGQAASAASGGVQGSNTALTVSLLYSPITTIVGALGGHYPASKQNGAAGWIFKRLGAGGTNGTLSVSLSGTATAAYVVQSGDIGTLMHLAFTYDGTNLRWYVNGNLTGTAAVASVALPSTPMTIGYGYGDPTAAMNDGACFAIGGGAYVATQAELAAQATASIAAGQLVAIPGKTDDRRYNFAQDAIDQATSLPAKYVNRANATDDPLARLGSGLTLAQKTERVWSYETIPILPGITVSDATMYYDTASAGIAGAASGFWVALLYCVLSQSVASRSRIPVAHEGNGGVGGWRFQTNGTNSSLFFNCVAADGTGKLSPASVINASDVGKLQIAVGVYDAPAGLVRLYNKRALVSTGTAITGYLPTATGMRVGGSSGLTTLIPDGIATYGVAGGAGIPSLAEVLALTDAVMAGERVKAIAGKTDGLWDFFGETALPAQMTDRIGAQHLARVGTPIYSPQYARGWGF